MTPVSQIFRSESVVRDENRDEMLNDLAASMFAGLTRMRGELIRHCGEHVPPLPADEFIKAVLDYICADLKWTNTRPKVERGLRSRFATLEKRAS